MGGQARGQDAIAETTSTKDFGFDCVGLALPLAEVCQLM